MSDDLDALGAQYRAARDAIGPHRRVQAEAEVAYAMAAKAAGGDTTALAVVKAKAAVDKARADVEWCKAVQVAAGEAFKGVTFAEAAARRTQPRPRMAQILGGA